MDVPARAGRDRAVITRSARPGTGKGAVPPRSSRGSGKPVSPSGTEAVYGQLFDSFDRDRDDSYLLALGAGPQPQDRWGGTPLSDAEGNGHAHVAELLRQAVRDTPEAVAV